MGNIVKEAESAVYEAGRLFLDTSNSGTFVTKEGTANFATHIDYMVQEYMVKKLNAIIPGSNIITEESSNNEYSMEKPTWILDPVDGTINIAHNFMHSAVSLALFVDGRPELGIVYNPYTGEMFTGCSGKGAFLNNNAFRVSKKDKLSEALLLFGTTPYDRSKAGETFSLVEEIFLNCQDIRRSGSAALDIAYVACGRAEGFFELNLQPWDYAAGMVILQEAGGIMTNWGGESPDVLHPSSILADNGLIHSQMTDIINKKYKR